VLERSGLSKIVVVDWDREEAGCGEREDALRNGWGEVIRGSGEVRGYGEVRRCGEERRLLRKVVLSRWELRG
jgi:hypothetical protein